MRSVKFNNPQLDRDVIWQGGVSSTASASIPSSGRDDLIIDRDNESQVLILIESD